MLRAHIVKQRRELTIEVQLELGDGESLGMFGPSGAGKSTVLACIAGFEDPDAGSVQFGSRVFYPPSLPLHHRGIGYLSQSPGLFPHLRVFENVSFGVPADLAKHPEQAAWMNQIKERLQLSSIWAASAARVSSGQARRVSLARMLARKPKLMLLDEPFTGLDRQLIRELIDDLVFWNRELRCAMIAVDHQAEVLERLCPGQVMAMESGKMVQRGSWEDLRTHPATRTLQSLLAPL